MPGRWLLAATLVFGCALYADQADPLGVCQQGSGYVHHLCYVSGATPVNAFGTPLNGSWFNQSPGQTHVIIEGPWLGHRKTQFQTIEADWVVNAQNAGVQYSWNSGGGNNTVFPTGINNYVDKGQEVYSYYLRATSSGSGTVTGYLIFEFPIEAVFATNNYPSDRPTLTRLATSDGSFRAYNAGGFEMTYYSPTGKFVSLDDDASDWIMLGSGGDPKRIDFSFDFTAANQIDSIRILTATPEPAVVVLFGTVVAILAGALRFRKRRGA